jgi:iron complex transport system substrate-binding protein
MRIVSLLPSATEIVCALGLADALVGISHDCDFPPEVLGKAVLSEAIISPTEPSRVIEGRIRGLVHTGRSVYHLNEGALARLDPDLILTQELCAVCAPSFTLVKQAAQLLDAEVKIVSLEPRGLGDVLDNILLVGELTGVDHRARVLVERLRARIEAVRERAGTSAHRPRVACLEWFDPIYVGGHWVPEMVDIAGGGDVLGRRGEPSRVVAWDEIVAAQPEILVLMPCGFDIARARAELGALTARRGWQDLPAVRTGRVFLTDASSYFNRPGPRLVDGLEFLATALHPNRFHSAPPDGALERAPGARGSADGGDRVAG